MNSIHFKTLKDLWEVLLLFLIPIGGGIPGGVLLAQSKGIAWPIMTVLYFISDVILACVFEPLMKLFIAVGKRVPFIMRFVEHMRKSMQQSRARHGNPTSIFSLIMISFGVDPMTGRSAAQAAGHGFISGWLIAISGDMIFYTLLMISTLWLKSVLGDGTSATLIILALMIVVPYLFRRIRGRNDAPLT